MELLKTYERTARTAYPGNFTPPQFDLRFSFIQFQLRETNSPKHTESGDAGESDTKFGINFDLTLLGKRVST